MSLILQFTDRAINIIELSSKPGDTGKDVIVRSVTPEDLLGMLPKVEPKPTAEPPLPEGCAAIEGHPWLCVSRLGVVFREDKNLEVVQWNIKRISYLTSGGISPQAIADALRYIVGTACFELPELNLIVVANPTPK